MTEQERKSTSDHAWEVVKQLLAKTPEELESKEVQEIQVLMPASVLAQLQIFDDEEGRFLFLERNLRN